MNRTRKLTALISGLVVGLALGLYVPMHWESFAAWAQVSIAEHHATAFFNIFGWIVDKFKFLLGVVFCVVGVVVALIALAVWSDRKSDITDI